MPPSIGWLWVAVAVLVVIMSFVVLYASRIDTDPKRARRARTLSWYMAMLSGLPIGYALVSLLPWPT